MQINHIREFNKTKTTIESIEIKKFLARTPAYNWIICWKNIKKHSLCFIWLRKEMFCVFHCTHHTRHSLCFIPVCMDSVCVCDSLLSSLLLGFCSSGLCVVLIITFHIIFIIFLFSFTFCSSVDQKHTLPYDFDDMSLCDVPKMKRTLAVFILFTFSFAKMNSCILRTFF